MWMFTKKETGKNPPAGKPTYMIQYRMSPKTVYEFQKEVSSYVSILPVRHPFVRLISAYRDRVAGLKVSTWLYHKFSNTLHRSLFSLHTRFHLHCAHGKGGRWGGSSQHDWPHTSVWCLQGDEPHPGTQYFRHGEGILEPALMQDHCISVSEILARFHTLPIYVGRCGDWGY